MFSDNKCKSFLWIPWQCTLYCETRGVFISTEHMCMEYTRIMFCGNSSLCRLASLVWMEFNEAKHTTGRFFRTIRESLDAFLRLHVMPIRDFFINLYWNITNTTSPLSMPRITAVDECDNFPKTLKTSQMLLFWTPLLSGSYDVWGGTHATNPLKIKKSTSHSHLTLQRWVKQRASIYRKENFFPTESYNKTDIVM